MVYIRNYYNRQADVLYHLHVFYEAHADQYLGVYYKKSNLDAIFAINDILKKVCDELSVNAALLKEKRVNNINSNTFLQLFSQMKELDKKAKAESDKIKVVIDEWKNLIKRYEEWENHLEKVEEELSKL